MPGVVVIVSCGKNNIWNKQPYRGQTAAVDAFTGAPFKHDSASLTRPIRSRPLQPPI